MGTALISIRFSLRCPGLLFTNSPCQLTSHSLIPVLNPSDRLLQNRLMSGFICLRPHPPLLPSHFDYDPPASNSMKLLFLSQFVNRIFSSNYYYDLLTVTCRHPQVKFSSRNQRLSIDDDGHRNR